MKFSLRKTKAIVAGLLAGLVLVAVPMTVYAGYAPSGRATFQCVSPTNCPGANYVTFNSFTNAPNYGDERAFFDGKDAHDTSANGYLDKISVSDGQLLTLRVYIHNNANPNAIGKAAAVAHNTRLQVLLPKTVENSNFAAAAISAENANPGTVSDTVDFIGSQPFSVAFDQSHPAQITYRPGGTGNYVTRTLLNSSYVGDSVLNASFGDWDGCFNYSALVTMTVVVHMPQQPEKPVYSCDAFNIVADVNRTVKVTKFSATAKNGAELVGTVVDWDDNNVSDGDVNPVGLTHQYDKDGTYNVSVIAFFDVNGDEVDASGPNCVKQVTFNGKKPPLTPPTELVNTGPGQVAGIFAAVTAASTLGYRRILRRRLES